MPTQLETELDQLRTQVSELTEKSRTRKARITELETANTDLQTRLTASDAALSEATIGKPLRDLAAQVSAIPTVWEAEFRKHFSLEMREGKLTVLDSNGEPVKVDGKPVEFTAAAISKLVTEGDSDEAAVFKHLTLGSLSSGSGANHQHGRSQPMDSLHKSGTKEKHQPQGTGFGLR